MTKSAPPGGLLKLKPPDIWESIEADRLRSRESEYVADVGSECERSGGEFTELWMVCAFFSSSFLRLMMTLISSLCLRLSSLLLHHCGRLYSHWSPRCLHAVHRGVPSSHFFRRNRQV